MLAKEYAIYLYQDKFHFYYKNQFSSLAVYKGNKIFDRENKILLNGGSKK